MGRKAMVSGLAGTGTAEAGVGAWRRDGDVEKRCDCGNTGVWRSMEAWAPDGRRQAKRLGAGDRGGVLACR